MEVNLSPDLEGTLVRAEVPAHDAVGTRLEQTLAAGQFRR